MAAAAAREERRVRGRSLPTALGGERVRPPRLAGARRLVRPVTSERTASFDHRRSATGSAARRGDRRRTVRPARPRAPASASGAGAAARSATTTCRRGRRGHARPLLALPTRANARNLIVAQRTQMAAHGNVHLAKQIDHLVAGNPEFARQIVYSKLAQPTLLLTAIGHRRRAERPNPLCQTFIDNPDHCRGLAASGRSRAPTAAARENTVIPRAAQQRAALYPNCCSKRRAPQ